MKARTIGIVALVLILLVPVLIWGNARYRLYKLREYAQVQSIDATDYDAIYHRDLCERNLKALAQALIVYSNEYDDELISQNGLFPNDTFVISDPNVIGE